MLGDKALKFLKSLCKMDRIWDWCDNAEYSELQLTQFAERFNEQEENKRWVDVIDNLPNKDEEVIVQFTNPEIRVSTAIFQDGVFEDLYGNEYTTVKYWMRLPEPKAE